jgi:hypothetical protein
VNRGVVYEQPGNEVDGSCHKRRVPSKYIEGGAKGSKEEQRKICYVNNSCLVVYIMNAWSD